MEGLNTNKTNETNITNLISEISPIRVIRVIIRGRQDLTADGRNLLRSVVSRVATLKTDCNFTIARPMLIAA